MSEELRIQIYTSGLLPPTLLLVMLILVEVGWQAGRIAFAQTEDKKIPNDKTLISAIFGLLALLVAFMFSGAANRFDERRQLIVEEVRAIDSAHMALKLLPKEQQPVIRQLFLSYVDHRIALYQNMRDQDGFEKRLNEQTEVGKQLWQASLQVVRETNGSEQSLAAQILPAMARMIDAVETARLALKFHPPHIMWESLMLLALIGSFLSGYNSGIQQKRDWLGIIVFAVLLAGAVYIILNMEYPRLGSVNLNGFDQELIILRKTM
jgi:hypothetical protein